MLKYFAGLAPRRSAQREKGVKRTFRKHALILKLGRAEMTEFFENGKIDNQIADRDSHARVALFRLKDTEWKILNGKVRIAWDFDERFERHTGKGD